MATATINEVDSIRREMAQIRQRLHQDMQGVVAGAEAASDWRHYVRLYPWAALGVAAVAGFVVVPRKRRSVTQAAEKAAEAAVSKIADVVESNGIKKTRESIAEAVEPKEAKKKGWIGGLIALAAPMALRAVQGYALSYVENWIAQQQQAAAGGPADGPSAGPVPPGAPPWMGR